MVMSMPKRIDLTGQVFEDLKVIRLSDMRSKNNTLLWECKCSCGETTYVLGTNLRAGNYKSCGCKRVSKRDNGVNLHINYDCVDGTRKTALQAKLHKGNKSGVKGVIWIESRQEWKAYIGFQGKSITLGYRKDKNEAIALRKAAEEKYHKPYLNNSFVEGGPIDKEKT
ncbi:HNH endonuclease [Paenibacillus azoreducens]|uniref:HNH endonuclease n=1 Tax=Paenibacillus azoreducens TaxID=116718 RepID=UPI0039F4EFBB